MTESFTEQELRDWLERRLTSAARDQVTTTLTRNSATGILDDIRAHRAPCAVSCTDSASFHCHGEQHCRCKSCHDSGKNSKFPDLSKVPVIGEDDVITAGELREALGSMPMISGIFSSRVTTDGYADRIMKHAADRREPEYSPGTVVRDADDIIWQRTSTSKWLTTGSSHVYAHGIPVRPLEVI